MTALLILLLANEPYVDLGPMLGHVGPDEARIWVKSSGRARLSVRVGEGEDARVVEGPELVEESAFMGHVRLDGLRPSTRYAYTVLLDGKPALSRPYPSFVTAPPEGAKGKLRFAFSSCVGKEGVASAAAWGEMSLRAPFDLLLLLGDNHYADTTDPAQQRAAYASHRRPAGYAEIARRVPTYAVWDDHDFGPNNSDGTAKGKEVSLRTFREHFANPAYGEEDNPGIYCKFSRLGVDFFLLDVRYHRTPNKTKDDGTKTMLGPRQLAWLKRELAASTADVKVLASGSEWQTHTQPDCWISFLRERDEIFRLMEERDVKGVVLLSGDRHFTAGYQVKGRFLEITAGPLGSKNFPSKNLPEMIFNFGEGKMWCVLEVDTSAAPPAVAVEVYRAGQGLIYKRPFTWDEVNGAAKIPTLPPDPSPAKK